MKKTKFITTGIIILAAAAIGGWFYYRHVTAVVNIDELYQTYKVVIDDVTKKVSGTGNVEVKDKVSIYLSSPQTVSRIHVKEGDSVSVGDILIDYDTEQELSDLNRRLHEAEIQLQNAQLNLSSIEQSAVGNELVQYYSDITTANKNITDAEADIIIAQKNISDAQGDIESIDIKISQQQLKVDDTKTAMDKNEILIANGTISQKTYDDSVTAYKNALESLNDLILQKDLKEKTLETRIIQEEYARQKLESRKLQAEYSEQRLANAQNRLSDEATVIQYNLQQNIISLNKITIEQIKSDIEKLTQQSLSPINGIVTGIHATEGGIISKGVPVITLSDTASIIIRFEVSEYDAPVIERNQKAVITTSALPDKVYNGTVIKIAEEAVEKENSSDDEIIVPIEISIDNADDKIKIGYSVDIDILTEEASQVIAIPIKALLVQDNQYYVYEVNNNEIKKTDVTIGLYGDKTVEVKSGLDENSIIILNPEDI